VPTPQPIPPELFARLAALDDRCEPSMVRTRLYPDGTRTTPIKDQHGTVRGSTPDRPAVRMWVVTIRLLGGLHHEYVQSKAPALASALAAAIVQAEARGWHKPAR